MHGAEGNWVDHGTFFLGIVGVTYYPVITNYGTEIAAGGRNSLIASLVLIAFHLLLVLLLWSYFSVVFTDPGGVPPNWRPAVVDERGNNCPSTALDFPPDSENGGTDFCEKCNQFKPLRCHHCSVCGRCVLKMEYHFVWVANCVGALNYKNFLLFLFYTVLETSLVTLSLFPHFIAIFSVQEIPDPFWIYFSPGTTATTFLAFVLNLVFAIRVMGLLIMHTLLVATNTTTIEAYEKKIISQCLYDLGLKRNFEQVFGMDKKCWFIPGYSKKDLLRMPSLQGLDYPSKPDVDAKQFSSLLLWLEYVEKDFCTV